MDDVAKRVTGSVQIATEISLNSFPISGAR